MHLHNFPLEGHGRKEGLQSDKDWLVLVLQQMDQALWYDPTINFSMFRSSKSAKTRDLAVFAH